MTRHIPLNYMVWGQAICQALYVVARLGIADRLRAGPKTAAELATAAGVNPGHLGRVLRTLTTFDLFKEDDDGRFAVTERGAQLQHDHPHSLWARAIVNGSPFAWRAWGGLFEAVNSGDPAFDLVHGEPFFDYMARVPADAALFHEAMTAATTAEQNAVLGAYDFSGYGNVVDVGGGQGVLLRSILERNPHLRGVLCDLPAVVAEAHHLHDLVVASRCQLHGGDFFSAVPADGDVYILKQILHDWNDEQALQILRNCRQAMRNGGKVLHIGAVLRPANEADFGKVIDLAMMTMQTGRERTEAELVALFARAGFVLTQVMRLGDWLAIAEGEAV